MKYTKGQIATALAMQEADKAIEKAARLSILAGMSRAYVLNAISDDYREFS